MYRFNIIVTIIVFTVIFLSCNRENANEKSENKNVQSSGKLILGLKIGMSPKEVNEHVDKLLSNKELIKVDDRHQFNLQIGNIIYYCKFLGFGNLGTFQNNKLYQISLSIDSCSEGYIKNGQRILMFYESKFGKGQKIDSGSYDGNKWTTYIWNLDKIRITMNIYLDKYEPKNSGRIGVMQFKTFMVVDYIDMEYIKSHRQIDNIRRQLKKIKEEQELKDSYEQYEKQSKKELDKI